MKESRPALAPEVVVENVGDQTLILVGNPARVVRLSPEAAELLMLIQHNPGEDFERTAALGELADLGVVVDTSTSALSRRGVIKLSAVAGAAGLSAVLLPTAAAASSPAGFTGTYVQGTSTRWDFTIRKADFPGAGIGDYGLTIGGTTYSGGGTAETMTWNSFDGPYSGDVVGTFLDNNGVDLYTVTFSPA